MSLKVHLQDKVARLVLQKTSPNITQEKAAFIKAKNKPDDFTGMVLLFTRYVQFV